ncbi:Uncharacterized protein HSRCO_2364 [Halanaeroarchaeum sp. HSR-CO]|uniref:hypothetical protein n=1 Tax=Halanaeroarchaeum sp. HSR-CO TaxID=2866382 RepID=UPI00217D8718|nr:hypothetical protein [Halanaeroarchaeum sp. HSR-CO]UWG48629.1 Uncharacterized protein HSRCO_2364 [Halanaeroarchaeum sp. HSR-CO]
MGRFDADTETDRVELVVDAIRAHRERNSRFTTLQTPTDADDDPEPWIQFDARESLLNLDCTDEELHRLEGLFDEFGGMTIHERTAPADVDGTNVRIRTRVDDERIAQFVEQCFRRVYERPVDYRLWVTAV